MPRLVKIEGQVSVQTDKGLRLVDWLELDGRAWIADSWIVAIGGKSQRPLRIIAPRFAPGFQMKGRDALRIFEEMPIPDSLLAQGHLPDRLKPLIEVRENPDIFALLSAG